MALRARPLRGRRPTAGDDAPTVVQSCARELHGEIRGSLTRLGRITGISLDALRVAKRPPGTSGARPLSRSRLRLLALLVAAHRMGVLDDLVREAVVIEDGWRAEFPDGVVEE